MSPDDSIEYCDDCEYEHDVETWCCDCEDDIGLTSHYHCVNCNRVSSMMGHYNFDLRTFTCVKEFQ